MLMITPSIDDAIKQLGHFEHFTGMENILVQLRALDNIDQENLLTEVNNLRVQLKDILERHLEITPHCNNVNIYIKGEQVLHNVICFVLLALAVKAPLNSKCPILGGEIPEDCQVFSLDGYQFNLKTLDAWHNSPELCFKSYSTVFDGYGDNQEWKYPTNPVTEKKFYDWEIFYFKMVGSALRKEIFRGVQLILEDQEKIFAEQNIHHALLGMDQLSGGEVTRFLINEGCANDIPSILKLPLDIFHLASIPETRRLFEAVPHPSGFLSSLLKRDKQRLMSRVTSGPYLIEFLIADGCSIQDIISFEDKNNTYQIRKLLERKLKASKEFNEFCKDSEWCIEELIALITTSQQRGDRYHVGWPDPQIEILEDPNVRRFLLDHQVPVKQFSEVSRYYETAIFHDGPTYHKTKEFVEDLALVAKYQVLLGPITDISDLFAGLTRHADENTNARMTAFKKKAKQAKQVKDYYGLSTEAGLFLDEHPWILSILHIKPNAQTIPAVLSVLQLDELVCLIALYASNRVLSSTITNELQCLSKNSKYRKEMLLQDWTELDSNGKLRYLETIPSNLWCFTDEQRDGLKFLIENPAVETALLSSIKKRGENSSLRAVLSSLADYKKQAIVGDSALMAVLEEHSVTLWDVLSQYHTDRLGRLHQLLRDKNMLGYLQGELLELDAFFTLTDKQYEDLNNSVVSIWIQENDMLSMQEFYLLSADQLRSICNPDLLVLHHRKILTKAQILLLTYTKVPWSLGFAIESGLFSSEVVSSWENANSLSEAEWKLYCHPVACQLLQKGRVTLAKLLALSPEQQQNFKVGERTFKNTPENDSYSKILTILEKTDDTLRLLSVSTDILTAWNRLVNCQFVWKDMKERNDNSLKDLPLSSFTDVHEHCLQSRKFLIF